MFQDSNNYREYLATELITPLVPGKLYYLFSYISRAHLQATNIATNNFGFKFVSQAYSPWNEYPTLNNADYHHPFIVSDTSNWVLISGTFMADSAYTHVLLGNFYDNSHTDTVQEPSHNQFATNQAYYYIDKVCVTEDPTKCDVVANINSLFEFHHPSNLYPNPFNNELHISGDFWEQATINLYNCMGQLVLKHTISNSLVLKTTLLPKGLYFYQIIDKGVVLSTGTLEKSY